MRKTESPKAGENCRLGENPLRQEKDTVPRRRPVERLFAPFSLILFCKTGRGVVGGLRQNGEGEDLLLSPSPAGSL